MKRISLLCSLLAWSFAAEAHATPILNPGNGHYYEFVSNYVSWTAAKAAASGTFFNGSRGYLATITSAEENAWILANILPPGEPITGVWIGGCQDPSGIEPDQGWGWCVCTGEAFGYANWETTFEPSPDNAGGCEEFIEMHLGSGQWGDAGNGPVPGGLSQTAGYVIEYGGTATVPCPTNATLCGSACSDGVDNDGNGCADYPSDLGCSSPGDNTESGGTCAGGRLMDGAPFATEVLKTTPAWERTLRSHLSPADTVWIGHVTTNTGLPGTPGGYGPYHIGRGPNNGPLSANGVWTFDHFQGGETDSLQGWWPIGLPYQSAVLTSSGDRDRPFFGLDYGNQGNYTINQGSPKRTFGVTSYWHRDQGVFATPTAPNASWAPLAGTASAWCGLRAHGDVTHADALALGGTGNPFNQSVLDFDGNQWDESGSLSTTGTDRNFPGYGSQWDQMLYRDVPLADNASMTLQFMYRTALSTGRMTNVSRRVGWFDKDPLKPVTPMDGNFISSSDAGLNAPADSFMVYVGVPVEPVSGPDNDFRCTDGTWREIADRKRRWFSEVIAIDKPYQEVRSVAGTDVQTVSIPISPTVLQPILDAQPGAGGLVRIVFRVKTNRGFDDEDSFRSGFSSATAGAVIVDNVAAQANGGGPDLISNGDFESSSAINNDPAAPATLSWKATGKPPGITFHLHDVSSLPYEDPCGGVGGPGRLCNMTGNVLTSGEHPMGDKPGGQPGSNDQDRQSAIVSPTINLCSLGAGQYNGMGIDVTIAAATEILLWFDVHQNLFNYGETGHGYRVGWQSYPAAMPNGGSAWGEVRRPPFLSTTGGAVGCLDGFGGLAAGALARASHLIVTSNPSGVPDSIRCFIEDVSRCFALPLSGVQCSPTGGHWAGGYFDNLSIGFVQGVPPSRVSLSISSLFQDAFPTLSGPFVPGSTFDVQAADVKTGLNTAPRTRNLQRHDIPGDTAVVQAPGAGLRVDLVFRILPGVGNYVTIGSRASGLRQSPSTTSPAVANPSSTNFWESYLGNNGAFGTPAGHAGGVWDPNVWNSARCDTAERNLFPAAGNTPNISERTPGYWATMYHEQDPKYGTLGVAKNRCFLVDPAPGRNVTCSSFSPANTDQCNIMCGTLPGPPPFGSYPPAWVLNPGSGFDGNEVPGQPGKTREFTKIIPDAQLTPGAHVEYFFRVSAIAGGPVDLAPDTNRIVPQAMEGSYDGHRWQEFSVLPDRWKDPAFGANSPGMACMLVVDLGDRRGDELSWAAIADSIGMTGFARRGAATGWWAPAGIELLGTDFGSNDALAIRPHLGQAGTLWDIYQVKAGESAEPAGRLGSRLAYEGQPDLTTGKHSTQGPTPEMLNYYYRTLVILAGDLGAGTLGPIVDQTDDDFTIISQFLSSTSSPLPRGVIVAGRNIVEGQAADNSSLFPSLFGATLRSASYREFAGNMAPSAALTIVPPLGGFGYGVFNDCLIDDDVLDVSGGVAGAHGAAFYENVGPQGPYVASVHAPASGAHPSPTLVNGWAIGDQGVFGYPMALWGKRLFWFSALQGVFAGLNCQPLGTPVAVGDTPGSGPGTAFVNAIGLRSSNPTRGGEARLTFRLAHAEHAELRIYDLAGRVVKRVANRVFEPGVDHVAIWDGTDDSGQRVSAGLYFYEVRTPTYVGHRKLTILR